MPGKHSGEASASPYGINVCNETVAHLLGFNKNTVQRIFQLMGWQVRKRPIGFRPRVQAMPSVATTPNERWSTDMCRARAGRDGRATLALVPTDFPREPPSASVPGAQSKLLVRLVNGRYITGLTEGEWLARYEGCENLAQQFVNYCARKIAENPSMTQELCLARARKGFVLKVQQGEWDFSEAEQDWVMKRARQILGW